VLELQVLGERRRSIDGRCEAFTGATMLAADPHLYINAVIIVFITQLSFGKFCCWASGLLLSRYQNQSEKSFSMDVNEL
jgi:hypothetical protein